MIRWLCLFLLLTLSPAFAEEEKKEQPAAETTAQGEVTAGETPSEETPAEGTQLPAPEKATRFAPDHCDFEITFPEVPYNSRRCPAGSTQCYDVMSYTMVFDLYTTVDVTVTCNPVPEGSFKKYDETVMRAALEGMVVRNGVKDYDINYQELENMRQASVTGTSKTGHQDKIFTSQLWVGLKSVFTVQAELVGGQHDKADIMFSEILKSVHAKDQKPVAAAPAPTPAPATPAAPPAPATPPAAEEKPKP